MMDINRVLFQWFYKVFDIKIAGGAVKNENMSNKELAEQLHKPIIRKFQKRKLYLLFIDNIWGADFVDVQLINKFNKGIFFYYALLIFLVNKHGLFL